MAKNCSNCQNCILRALFKEMDLIKIFGKEYPILYQCNAAGAIFRDAQEECPMWKEKEEKKI